MQNSLKTRVYRIDHLAADGFIDDGSSAGSYNNGYLYKLVLPVHRNRSIETTITLFDASGTEWMHFPVRYV